MTLNVFGRARGGSPIEFWFDFASGYAYFAALEIEALAERHGRSILWRPFTLGAAFKVTGAQGLSRTPLKGEYARRDWQRLARLKGVVFKLPGRHPKVGLAAIRAFYHFDRIDPRAAARLAKHIITGYFRDGLDTDDPHAIAQLAPQLLGINRESVLAGINDPEVKAIARQHGEAAYSVRPGSSSMANRFGATIVSTWLTDGFLPVLGRFRMARAFPLAALLGQASHCNDIITVMVWTAPAPASGSIEPCQDGCR